MCGGVGITGHVDEVVGVAGSYDHHLVFNSLDMREDAVFVHTHSMSSMTASAALHMETHIQCVVLQRGERFCEISWWTIMMTLAITYTLAITCKACMQIPHATSQPACFCDQPNQCPYRLSACRFCIQLYSLFDWNQPNQCPFREQTITAWQCSWAELSWMERLLLWTSNNPNQCTRHPYQKSTLILRTLMSLHMQLSRSNIFRHSAWFLSNTYMSNHHLMTLWVHSQAWLAGYGCGQTDFTLLSDSVSLPERADEF